VFVPLAWKEQLFQFFAEIPVIVKYPHNAILDDVGHKYPFFVRLSILKYGKIENVTSGFQKKCKKGGFLEKKLYLRNGITKNLRI
jgi:hypothetical protein